MLLVLVHPAAAAAALPIVVDRGHHRGGRRAAEQASPPSPGLVGGALHLRVRAAGGLRQVLVAGDKEKRNDTKRNDDAREPTFVDSGRDDEVSE